MTRQGHSSMIRHGLSSAIAAALLCAALLNASAARAQVTATDLLIRIDQLEGQVRQLTGAVEQLQFRNQQLETALRKMQEENEFRFQELGGKGQVRPGGASRSSASPPGAPAAAEQPGSYAPRSPAAPQQPAYAPPPQQPAQPQPGYAPPPSGPPGRRSDAFDPSQNPSAPGAPRPLGSLYAAGGPADAAAPPVRPGAPVSLSGGPQAGQSDPRYGAGGLPPPPPVNPNATGAQVATLPPSPSPRDEYDLASGYLQRKDYALAEQSFREFLRKYPGDALAGDAQYGIGESLFRRQSYRDAADAFLTLTKSHARSPRAPDALLRLGQSLAALKEKDLACGAFAEIGRKYPRVSPTVKQTVEREQKRAGC